MTIICCRLASTKRREFISGAAANGAAVDRPLAANAQQAAVQVVGSEDYRRPQWTFNKLVYIEKEGFSEALKDNGWPERHDCGLISSKGYTTRAAKDLVDKLAAHNEPPAGEPGALGHSEESGTRRGDCPDVKHRDHPKTTRRLSARDRRHAARRWRLATRAWTRASRRWRKASTVSLAKRGEQTRWRRRHRTRRSHAGANCGRRRGRWLISVRLDVGRLDVGRLDDRPPLLDLGPVQGV